MVLGNSARSTKCPEVGSGLVGPGQSSQRQSRAGPRMTKALPEVPNRRAKSFAENTLHVTPIIRRLWQSTPSLTSMTGRLCLWRGWGGLSFSGTRVPPLRASKPQHLYCTKSAASANIRLTFPPCAAKNAAVSSRQLAGSSFRRHITLMRSRWSGPFPAALILAYFSTAKSRLSHTARVLSAHIPASL